MITIVTGDIRSGKTTLARDLFTRHDVGGIVAPGDNSDRVIMDLSTGTTRRLIGTNDDDDVVRVGRFKLHRPTLDWANDLLLHATKQPTISTIVIDEIGKLELAGGGHAAVIPSLVRWSLMANHELVVVVREELGGVVWERFFEMG